MKSVIRFSLEVEVSDEDQYKKIVQALVEEFPLLEMHISVEIGDSFNRSKYIISTGEYSWANNLMRIAEILDEHDVKMQ